MKNLLVFMFTTILFISCNKTTQWEYKIVKVAGTETLEVSNFTSKIFPDQSKMLNKMGSEGWELVSTYTEEETVFPNFGNEEYVTGIRTNTRTTVLNFVFKRQGIKEEKPKKMENKKK